ncbi:MAG: hypothetical protein NZ524_04690 [Thiobacillaceae bacterium]|nr:hypothetical protein [Thiobacillaceae bacterium]MCX7673277.1 hypothetical protein [Thiobacillaceae bacterium]MDW8324692.1 hypothetical protein [Burkholderiales bacterium]
MPIPPFSAADLNLVRAILKERYGREVEVQEVETEVRLSPADRELTLCPALFWKDEQEMCAFVVARTGPSAYRAMFYYSVKDRFGTGREEYDSLGDCVVTMLKVQEEVARQRAQETGAPPPGKTTT